MRRAAGLCVVAATLALTVTACGAEEKDQAPAETTGASASQSVPASSPQSSQQAPAPESSAVQQPTQSAQAEAAPGLPAGYTPEDFYGFFGSAEVPQQDTVNPPQCAPLAFDAITLVEWGATPQDVNPVEMYTSGPEINVFVREDSTLAGFDAAGCETLARESASDLGTTVTTYATQPIEVSVPGADRVQGFTQTVSGVTLDGADLGQLKAGEETTILIVEAAGKTYYVAGSGGAGLDDLATIAQDRIARG